jgi:NAD-dependent deacetylase
MREEPMAAVRARVDGARSLFVLTGAGMSAESGIPTFRDALTGLWSRFDPAQLASEEGFRADPQTVWDWYAERRDAMRLVQPNAGHLALGAFERRRPGVLTLVSQNVDDLHQRAGNTATIRLHGELLADRWLDRCARSPACPTQQAQPGRPPRCALCGNLVRPAVVWFGEMLPQDAIDAAERVARTCDVALIVGTSGAVWPAAGLAALARRAGAFVAIINPHESEIDDQAHVVLRATAAQGLPRLLNRS